MALQGCCCCFGLRGGAKAVGVLFLGMTLLQLRYVIMLWAFSTIYPTNDQSFDVDTSQGQFGVQVGETQSMFNDSGEDATLNLGQFGGGSISSEGRVSVRTPGGEISSDGQSSQPDFDSTQVYVLVSLICYTVFVLLSLLFNSMLIHGTNHDSSCAVLAWLVFYGAAFVVMSLASIGVMITAMVFDVAPISIASACGLLGCALLWFWWVLVLTFYRELRDGTRGFKYHRDVSLQEPPTPRAPHPTTQRKAEDYA